MSTVPAVARLGNRPLLDGLAQALAHERASLVVVLSYLAEVGARRLYRDEGYPSLYTYCVQHLKLSEQGAYRRIRAASLARRFPVLLTLVAEGRLHLSAITLLALHVTRHNAAELFAAAAHRSKRDVQQSLAERFPLPDHPTRLRPLLAPASVVAQQPGIAPGPPKPLPHNEQPAETALELAPGRVAPSAPPAIITPSAPQRFGLEVAIDQETHDLLRRAQELLAHQLPSGNVAEVLRHALQVLVRQLERQKFAATDRPLHPHRRTHDRHHIPAHVKRAVTERDRGRCTFVSDSGHRCEARSFLEYDHIQPVARGGPSSIDNVRLRCRAHNQLHADRTFGAGFMDRRRTGAQLTRAVPS